MGRGAGFTHGERGALSILAGSTPGKGIWIHPTAAGRTPALGWAGTGGAGGDTSSFAPAQLPLLPWPGFSISLQGMEVFCSRVLHSVILAEFRAVGSVPGQSCARLGKEGAVLAAGGVPLQGAAHPGVSRGFVRRSCVCARSLACPGVEGSAGTPKPSAQLSLDRAVLLQEQVCFVHTFLKGICAHLECEGLVFV